MKSLAVLALTLATIGAGSAQTNTSKLQPIPWSASRHLTWADYLGAPDFSTDAAAMTVYLIGYSTECTGDRLSFSVTTTFQPDRSWVRSSVLESTVRATRLLEHEQLHFDLSELHARKIRQWLAGLSKACSMTRGELEKLVTNRVRDITSTQLEYDRDTDFGLDARAQAKWSADTAKALDKMAAWASL